MMSSRAVSYTHLDVYKRQYFVLILVGVIMIYPLLWMISATFKDNSEIFAGISLWIKHPTLDGYRGALNNFGGSINILQAMLNTYSSVSYTHLRGQGLRQRKPGAGIPAPAPA